MRTRGAPSHNRYSHFRLEEGVITNINRKTWTVTVETRHSSKTVEDIQWAAPYHHYANGEGIHHMPEVGAICLLAWPSDNTPPCVLGYLGMPAVDLTPGDYPRPQATDNPEGSPTDVSFRSRRPDLNPGDIAITTRDENFIIARRGGIVQLGATPLSQRIYIPVLNYIKDFCENYEMHAFGGELSWRVQRPEADPSGKAPSTWTLNLLEFAQDTKATVRIRHLPPGTSGSSKEAWDVAVAPQGIDLDDGSVSSAVYTMVVSIDGKKVEMSADRTITVQGKDTLTVQGDQEISVTGSSAVSAQRNIELIAGVEAVLGGTIVKLGSKAAVQPAVLGPTLVALLNMPMIVTPPGPPAAPIGQAMLSPPQLALLATLLSTKVFLE